MLINSISDKTIEASLSADDLMAISDALYIYSKHCDRMDAAFHDLVMQVIMARDLCQYGHLDTFSLDTVIAHSLKADLDARFPQLAERMAENGIAADMKLLPKTE